MSLVEAQPEPVKESRLPFPKNIDRRAFIHKDLSPWIKEGFLAHDGKGLALRFQHLHIPKTSDWTEVRNNNSRLAFETLLSSTTPKDQARGDCYRELVYRPLTASQATRWATQLKKVEADFKADPYERDSEGYALLMVFGRRPS